MPPKINNNLDLQLNKLRREAEERDAQRQAQKYKLSYINLLIKPVNIEALALINEIEARKAKMAVVNKKENKLVVAVFSPEAPQTKKILENLKGKNFEPQIFVSSLSGLEYVFSFYKFVEYEQESITGKFSIGAATDDNIFQNKENFDNLEKVKNLLASVEKLSVHAPKFFEIILFSALINRASDIHFEPTEKKINLRFRIDGILHDVFSEIEKKFYLFLLARIKLLSNLKINISDEPQDGRFTIRISSYAKDTENKPSLTKTTEDKQEKDVEVRVAIAPSEFGEVVVMRLLDPAAISLNLTDLGLRDDDLKIIETELKRPNGMIINTGPTGSGKTTTLYAFLRHQKSSEIKIITVEDPIEYHLEGIEQTQVDEERGYTFASGLRSLMRQDPDVILIGEMRDKETAEIAVQAALTGHLVFSTIHANSAAGAIPRLIDIGVKQTSIGPALNLAIAQRLVRRLCANCKMTFEADENLKSKIENFLIKLPARVNKENYKELKMFQVKKDSGKIGCEKCNFSGYRGRVAIYELLLNDPEYEKILRGGIILKKDSLFSNKDLEAMIASGAGESTIKKWAIENQEMTTMQQDGILKVLQGITTFNEVEETTGFISW